MQHLTFATSLAVTSHVPSILTSLQVSVVTTVSTTALLLTCFPLITTIGKIPPSALQDVQVLTPMRRNLLGAENLNAVIQARLNGTGPAVMRGGMSFRAGDRVMQLRNNYDKDVYNGDIGFVQSVVPETRSLVVLFDGRPVEYASGDLDELVLAYATTIHKSQGSEYPAVIVLMHRQHYMMLQRNLLYTAITRGKKLVLVIGAPWAVKTAIETNTVRERRTTLAEKMQERAGESE